LNWAADVEPATILGGGNRPCADSASRRWLRTEPLLPRSVGTGLFKLAWHSRCPVPPCRHCVAEVREREPHPIANPHRSRLLAFRGPPWCCRELGVAAAPCAVSRGEDTRQSAVHRGQTICAPTAGKIQVLGASLLPVIVFRQVWLASTQTIGRIYSPEL
jgi:hypothetical protein